MMTDRQIIIIIIIIMYHHHHHVSSSSTHSSSLSAMVFFTLYRYPSKSFNADSVAMYHIIIWCISYIACKYV